MGAEWLHVLNVVVTVLLCVLVGFSFAKFKLPFDHQMVSSLVANVGYPTLILAHLSAQHVTVGAFFDMLAAATMMVAFFGIGGVVFLSIVGLPKRGRTKLLSVSDRTYQMRSTIGILTGGGDVPGLNPAIRAVTIRALREGHRVIGIRRGWGGLVDIVPDRDADNSGHMQVLTEEAVNKAGRTGGTFLHTSRTRPSHLPRALVPRHLRDKYKDEISDITPDILTNLDFLGIDYLIPIGGDDTLSYGVHLHEKGVPIVAIPKTMDNDVPGTDYCIGFSTCVTRTIELTHKLRTTAGSHERFLVIEVFGRYAGFSALLPTMAGAADRCVIPEHTFNIESLADLLVHDRDRNPSNYSVVLVSEGAQMKGDQAMSFESEEADQFGHRKLGGIGDRVAAALKELSPRFNQGRRVNVVSQRLGYLVRCGDPDALDSIVPMAFGNLALDLIDAGNAGRLVAVHNGHYDSAPINTIVGAEKSVDVEKYYHTDRLRPKYKAFGGLPLFIMTSDV